jgi:hypothetical protein
MALGSTQSLTEISIRNLYISIDSIKKGLNTVKLFSRRLWIISGSTDDIDCKRSVM